MAEAATLSSRDPVTLASRRAVLAGEQEITSSWYPACDVFEDRREDRRRAARSEAEDVKLTLENKTP